MDCKSCMAMTGPMGKMVEQCQRLIAAGLCQKQVAITLALKSENSVVEGDYEEVRCKQ